MKHRESTTTSSFDEYAASYDHALAQGLAATGEDKNYFARRRVEWLRRCLDRLGFAARSVVEFGCGTGSNISPLIELLGAASVVGLDASEKSLEIARRTLGSRAVRFYRPSEYEPTGQVDLIFCNGVFHHIQPENRRAAVEYLFRCLKPGGIFALWENNPWNPGTRHVMSRIPFDKDAITLTSMEARRTLHSIGLEILRTDFLFIFPHLLRFLRSLEPVLCRLPIGGQYQVLFCKPAVSPPSSS
jgi:SAM-dependent methyltransferase